jgi:DNA-binding NarL/FixJ family response regulator
VATSLKIKVLIADDHTVVRQGLRLLVETAGDMEVVGEADNGAKAVEEVKALRPNVVVMDLSMPHMDGMEATRQIRSKTPASKVLVLSSYSGDEMVARSIENGATGYVIKQSAANDLLKGIREVHKGRAFFSAPIANRLADLRRKFASTQQMQKRSTQLTPRELEVLHLISKGHPNKQVADILKISIKTVEKHRQQVMDKLNIHEVAGLTRYVCAQESAQLVFPSLAG